MKDSLSPTERSVRMSRVRSTGNRSTEAVVDLVLRREKIGGWKKHPLNLPGKPDFFFVRHKLAVFVNGCFWHSCGRCLRRVPSTRRSFWRAKLSENSRRDSRVSRNLRSAGYHVMTIWEHELRSEAWLRRLKRMLRGHTGIAQSSSGGGKTTR